MFSRRCRFRGRVLRTRDVSPTACADAGRPDDVSPATPGSRDPRARRQARMQRPPLTVAQPELVPEAMAREECGGQAAERAPSQAHLVRPRQRVDASARHVLAVVDERLAFAELEHQLQPLVNVVASLLQIHERHDDAIPQRSGARTCLERGMVERDERPLAWPACHLRLSLFADRLVPNHTGHAADDGRIWIVPPGSCRPPPPRRILESSARLVQSITPFRMDSDPCRCWRTYIWSSCQNRMVVRTSSPPSSPLTNGSDGPSRGSI